MVKEFVTERLRLIDIYPDKAKSVAKEYGLKEDEVELIRKGRISTDPVIDRDARTVVNYISTDAIDRDNEVIEHRGVVLDDYKKNPIVPWGHDYHSLPIGKNLWIKSDKKGLVAKTYFLRHPFAQQVFDLYTEDIAKTGPALKAWSVGFIPLKWKDAKNGDKDALPGERSTEIRRTYKKWLLLEYSAVPVPSNPEALTLMVEKGLIKNDKLKKDIEEFIKEENTNEVISEAKNIVRDELVKEEAENTCKALVTKPEETDDFIRIPIRDCKVTATITISADQGITALYCGEVKKIRTYIFSKKAPHRWTMKRALAWVKEHGKRVDDTIELCALEDIDLEELQDLLGLDDENRKAIKIINEEKQEEEKQEKEDPIKWMKKFADEMREIKEGRVLSGKNLKLVKDCREQITVTGELLDKLIVASEPPKEESILPLIEDSKENKKSKEDENINSLTKDDMPVIVEETVKGIIEAMSGQHKEIQKLFDKKRGKVS